MNFFVRVFVAYIAAFIVSEAATSPVNITNLGGGNYMVKLLLENPSLTEITVSGTTYWVSKARVTQNEASLTCQKYGLKLISVPNQETTEDIVSVIQQAYSTSGYWLSLKKEGNGNWLWGNSKPLTYSNWAPGEPNNTNNDEDCVITYHTGTWNDVTCNTDFYFICENPNPECSDSGNEVVNLYVDVSSITSAVKLNSTSK